MNLRRFILFVGLLGVLSLVAYVVTLNPMPRGMTFNSEKPIPSSKETLANWEELNAHWEENVKLLNVTVSPPTIPENWREQYKFIQTLDKGKLKQIKKEIMYWDLPHKKTEIQPIRHEKFLTWMPYSAGLNNRRISMEIAYAFAYITNRTLVLPPISGWQNPFPSPFLMEELHDERDLRNGWPVMTWKEWLAYPNRGKIWDDTVICNWDLKWGNSLYVVPEIPKEEDPEFQAFSQFVAKRQPMIHIRDDNTVPRFREAKNIFFPEMAFFVHFYLQFYFRESSPVQLRDVTTLIRDYVHFPEEMLEWVTRILYLLPNYSAMHIRKGDFGLKQKKTLYLISDRHPAYPTSELTPDQIFTFTKPKFEDDETIYVSTDEDYKEFQKNFVPVFGQRYKVVTFANFSRLLYDMPPLYEPMVEMFICSNARVFIGTMYSTYTGYIQRLRGYHRHIKDKGPHYTDERDPNDAPLWGREWDEGWNTIEDLKQ